MSTRKRIRPSPADDQEEDELSPTKNRTNKALGQPKKRKLNDYGSSPLSKNQTALNKGLFGTIRSLTGALGLGLGQKNTDGSEDEDELMADPEKDLENGLQLSDSNMGVTSAPAKKRGRTSGKVPTNASAVNQHKAGKADDIFDFPDSDSERPVPFSLNRKRSPSKQRIASEGSARGHGAGPTPKGAKQVSHSDTGQEPMKTPKGLEIDMVPSPKLSAGRTRHSNSAPSKATLLKRDKELSRINRRNELLAKDERANAGSKEAVHDIERSKQTSTTQANAITSIDTSGEKKGDTSRKSVAFEHGVDMGLGAEELPTSIKGSNPASVEPGSGSGDENVDDDEDEIACEICAGLDSKKPNLIVICESCEKAVHQQCYSVPKVPKGDWFCRDCQKIQQTGSDLTILKGDDLTASIDLPDIVGFEDHLRTMQRFLLDRLTSHKCIKLRGHDEELQKVYQVVEQSVVAGEGNSMLLIGARGSGKTTLVESLISDLSAEHGENFHVVRLNGFVHTDDKLALKEIWRQLGREMDIEDSGKSNYADTLASLLALLSHPSELSADQAGQTAKSVIFVLDEFDLFTTHPRQTLLYNLFDIAQARKAPIMVLGLTTKVDVVETLEKRVKSRFSHRFVHLSLPRSPLAFWEVCQGALTASSEDLDAAGLESSTIGLDEFLSFWQVMVRDLYDKDNDFKTHLQSCFFRTKSVPEFFTSCIFPILNLSTKRFPLIGKHFMSISMPLSAPDSKLHILPGLSDLEVALLIAAARLDIILDTDTCNFAMTYNEYSSLVSRHKLQTSSTGMAALGASAKVWGKEIALGAWERLADLELLVPAAMGGGSARDFGSVGRMWKVDVGLEEITGSIDGLSTVMSRWCREI